MSLELDGRIVAGGVICTQDFVEGLEYRGIRHDSDELWFILYTDPRTPDGVDNEIMLEITEEQLIHMITLVHDTAEKFGGCGNFGDVFDDLPSCNHQEKRGPHT